MLFCWVCVGFFFGFLFRFRFLFRVLLGWGFFVLILIVCRVGVFGVGKGVLGLVLGLTDGIFKVRGCDKFVFRLGW